MGPGVRILAWLVIVLWTAGWCAAAQDSSEHPLVLDAPDGLCAADGTDSGSQPDSELQRALVGHTVPVMLLRPCEGSAWPEDSEVMVGLVVRGDTLEHLDITREQYLSRLARREAPAEQGALAAAIAAVDDDLQNGTIATGVLARDGDAIHFGYIHSFGSRNEADWRYAIIGSSLLQGYPTIVTSRGDYVDLAAFQSAVQRHVGFTKVLVESNSAWSDDLTVGDLHWVKYAIAALVALGGLAAFWNWCRLRRRGDADLPVEDDSA